MTDALPAGVTVFERGWLSSNNILIVGRETALIDSGYVTHSLQTVALVDGALGGRPLDILVNTHLHSDHCGGNAALQQRYPAVRTHVPGAEFDVVVKWDESQLSYHATGQDCPPFSATSQLVEGSEHRLGDLMWEVHAAPGHDPRSVILFEPVSATLVSADALWERGFGVVFPELIGEPSFAEVSQTLDLIESLAPRQVVPGHGRIFSGVAPALKTARLRLETLSAHPSKHARYAFKVLVKFKLLEQQSMTLAQWEVWRERTPYLETIRSRFFSDRTLASLGNEILDDLIRSGAARREAGRIFNAEPI